jgi:amino acid adenylation domain-containing protein
MATQQDLQKIWEWNRNVPASVDRCVHEIIEHRTQAQPDAPAICAWDGELTYGELDRLATRLAGRLINSGVGPDVLVPLCFEKSMWTTVAILGVLKAGGGIVMLEPSSPKQRLEDIVQQSKARLILSSVSNNTISLQLSPNVVTVCSDLFSDLDDNTHQHLCSLSRPSSIIYVIFTSGSTGTPKGVIVTHKNVASALHYQTKGFGLTGKSRVFDFASYAFDVSISNTLNVLAAGGCLCVPSEQDRKDRLTESIASMHANFVQLTPSVAQFLHPDQLPDLQSILFGGETLHVRDVQPWCGKARVIHTYGPAECTSTSTINQETSSPEEATRIGKGVGLVTWVVDSDNHNRLLKLGETGELLLEGPLVGNGYLNGSDKAAATFIEDPAWLLQGTSGHPGRRGRIYKTGDLVRYNADGSLTFIGRKDTQIKIHGQRVELGEVEHHVKNCMQEYIPEIQHVLAEMITPQGENPRISKSVLAAFIQVKNNAVGTDPESTSAEIFPIAPDVEDKLAECLPTYMIPSVYLIMKEIPLTITGKKNRKRLREIGASITVQQLAEIRTSEIHKAGQGTRSEMKEQPTSVIERQMQRIWASVLNIELNIIGLDDSFFRLGGDSISAMKVVAEARKNGIALEVADFFRFTTLRHVTSQAHNLVDGSSDDILPFTLLKSGVHDITSLLQDISVQCQLDPSSVQDIYPCTPLQEGLLSLSSKRPGDYIRQAVLELSSDVTISTFCTAWEEVAENMPILRTRIVQAGNFDLLQVVLGTKIQWAKATGLNEYLETDKKQPMEIGQPLSRYALIKDNTGTYRWFIWTAHHVLYDGWSLPLILGAVNRAYRGDALKSQPHFKVFIKYLIERDNEKTMDYWRNTLADYDSTPFPALPPSVKQPVTDSVTEYQISKPRELSLDITISNLLRAAWGLVVGRMTNVTDVVFGVSVSGRNAPVIRIDEMAAPTIATVPVRVNFAEDWRISDYLEAVQRQATEMIPFEQTGLNQIAKTCPGAQLACKFQTLLVIQPQENNSADDALGKWRDGSQKEWINTYALVLEIFLDANQLTVKARFDSSAIELWKVQKLLERLEFVIQQLCSVNPSRTLAGIELITEKDLKEIWGWNRIVPSAVDRCVHHIIEERAKANPSAPAVCAWDGELTYSELDTLATQLARRLVQPRIGIQPGMIVPLCFEKSMWTTVAILGVLKTGASFVLLDSSLPKERLQTIIRQVEASLILSSVSNKLLSLQLGQEVVVLSPDFVHQSGDQANQVSYEVSPSSLMYVVFTSGSTGTPKGVMITHRNFATALHHQTSSHGITGESRVFDFASYGFDASIISTFMALYAGGCLCVPSDQDRRNRLGESIVSLRANVIHLTPSVAQLLIPEKTGIRIISIGGETVHTGDIKRWWGLARVFNIYGPSECTPFSTINHSASTPEEALCIGKGVGQVTWIVDPENDDRLLPPGCVGELLLEGPLVGNGYLKDPEKTEIAFIQDPIWLLQGDGSGQRGRHGRLYKTGDLVRYTKDGNLIYVGRKDSQVKLRGQRVELGEVEYRLQESLPEIRHVVAEVIVPQGEKSRPMLVAFIQMEDDRIAGDDDQEDITTCNIITVTADVEEKLAKHLPIYMVPNVFFAMRDLPMTATGKMDRKRLREIGGSFSMQRLAEVRTDRDEEKQQPTSSREIQMQTIWAQVLNIDLMSIGSNDSFFQLGGDSISAMKVVAEARKDGMELVVGDIFRHMTLARVALSTNRSRQKPHGKGDIRLDPVDKVALLAELDSSDHGIGSTAVADILPVTSVQEFWVAMSMHNPQQLCNYFYVDVGASLDISRFEMSCSLLVECIPILRSYCLPLLGKFWLIVLHKLDIPLLIRDVDDDLDRSVNDFCLKDTEEVSMKRPSVAFTLLRHKTQGIRFVFRLSHTQYDGVSLPVLFQLLLDIYKGKASPQVPDFSEFLSHSFRQRTSSIQYWKQVLQGSSLTTLMELAPKEIHDPVPKNIHVSVERDIRHTSGSITLASLLCAAWALLLSHITGDADIVYGRAVSGRNSAFEGVEKIIGPCINLVPVRIKLSSLQSLTELLLVVQEQFLSIGEADSLGFKDIIDHSTDWLAGSGYSSIVHHQNIADVHEEIRFADVSSPIRAFENPNFLFPCVYLESHARGDRLTIELYANTLVMTTEKAQAILNGFCQIVEKVMMSPDISLQSCINEVKL